MWDWSYFHYQSFASRIVLSPHLFLVIDGLTRHTQKVVDDYIALIDKTREWIASKRERWREVMKSKEIRINRTKTEYMKCNFSYILRRNEHVVQIDCQDTWRSMKNEFRICVVDLEKNTKIIFFFKINVGLALRWINHSSHQCWK